MIVSALVAWSPAPALAQGLDASFPSGSDVGYLLRLEASDLPGLPLFFDVSAEGQPFLLAGSTVAALWRDAAAPMVPPVTVPGELAVDSFAIMGDGSFFATAGRRLGALTTAGFVPLLSLPDAGKRVAAAGSQRAYVFGGSVPDRRRDLYLYRKDGRLTHLFRAPGPITSVTGVGEVTFVGVGASIYLLRTGQPLTLAYEADAPVLGLALAPPSGLFFATERSAGYVASTGRGYTFLKGRRVLPYVGAGQVFFYMPDERSVLRCAPVSGFDELARRLEALEQSQ